MLTFRPLKKLFHEEAAGVSDLNVLMPSDNAKLFVILSVVEFTVRTNTASCRTVKMMARRQQGGGCFICSRLSST